MKLLKENLKSEGMQYLTQTELFVNRAAACRKPLLYMRGFSVSLTLCSVLNASHSSGIKPVTGTCHLQFGPLQGGTPVCCSCYFLSFSRSQRCFREDHRDVHRQNPILPCLAEESDFDSSLTQYKCSSGNVQAGGFL